MTRWQTGWAVPCTPQNRRDAVTLALRRQQPLIVAVAALAAMLVLGWALPGPRAPGFGMIAHGLGKPGLSMLPMVAGAGLLAHQLAALTRTPRADPAEGALAATLIAAAAMPGLGAAALIVPQLLAFSLLGVPGRARLVALMVQCIAILSAAAVAGSAGAAYFAYATTLAGAWVWLLRPCSDAANDNPHMKRGGQFSRLPLPACYARYDSQPGEWEYGSV